MDNTIYLHLQRPCGLCNRLYSLETALRLQYLIPGSRLEVYWPLGPMMATRPQDLFNLPEVAFNIIEESEPILPLDPGTEDAIYVENYKLLPEILHAPPSFYIGKELRTLVNPAKGNIHIVTETGMYVKFNTNIKGLTLKHFSRPITDQVARLEKKHNLSSLMGVHFRGQDFRGLYPEHADPVKFITKLRRHQSGNPFFISTDEESFLDQLQEADINFISQKDLCYDRKKALNGVDAAVDLLLLSRCKSLFLSSHNSTFGLFAKHLQGHQS